MKWKRISESIYDAPRVVWAWAWSFARNDWKVTDYPLRFRHQDNRGYDGPARLKPIDWTVRVLRWTAMQGHGDSRESAMQNLRENFTSFQERGEQLPRPGTYKQIEFAPTNAIEQYAALEQDFIANILDAEWAFLSNESSLWDFSREETLDDLYDRIQIRYGVDVSDIEGANLVAIFARLDQSQG